MDSIKTGNLIREKRTEKNYTQKELAEKISVSPAAVSKWENGKGFPDISILENLSSELGLSITELITGETSAHKTDAEAAVKDIIEISEKKSKSEKLRQIFIILAFFISFALINTFLIIEGFSNYKLYEEFSVNNSGIIGLFTFIFGANAIVFALFNLLFGKRFSTEKTMQISLYSEACCAASIWMTTVYTDYKIAINDISAVLDTANAFEIYSRMIFIVTVILNLFAFRRIIGK